MAVANPGSLEDQIEQWRSYLRRRTTVQPVDIARMEEQLRAEIGSLTRAGLAVDEAFLVALKRVGGRGATAPHNAERAWQQFVVAPSDSGESSARARTDSIVAWGLAVLAAVAIKVPSLFGIQMGHDADAGFYLRNASLFVLPCLVGYFVWKRRLAARTIGWLAAAFVVAAVFANLPGFGRAREFEQLTALHLPIALLLAVGIAYAGGRWREVSARMDFIRFSGELFIYYVLIALGGGVLCAFMALTFKSIGVKIEPFFQMWLVPCGAAGAVVVAS
jgi:hypothetical protein